MIRSNVGNIVTNGQQILSVGAFTAGGLKRSLGRADTALNNLSKEERQNYIKMQADKMRDEMNAYNSGGASATQHLSEEELTQYRQAQADDMRKKINKSQGSDVESVDKIMGATSSNNNAAPLTLKENSEQAPYLNTNFSDNYEWLEDKRGEDSNADV